MRPRKRTSADMTNRIENVVYPQAHTPWNVWIRMEMDGMEAILRSMAKDIAKTLPKDFTRRKFKYNGTLEINKL